MLSKLTQDASNQEREELRRSFQAQSHTVRQEHGNRAAGIGFGFDESLLSLVSQGGSASYAQVAEWLVKAWAKITTTTDENGFRKCQFSPELLN